MSVRTHAHTKQVSAVFESYRDFTHAMSDLQGLGLTHEDVSILMSEGTKDQYLSEDAQGHDFAARESTKAPEGFTAGGLAGGLLGALIGGLTIAGSVVLTLGTGGAGLLVAGPILGALSGGAIGAAAGGLVGGLVGLGIPEHEARFFEDALKEEGNVLVVARVPNDLVTRVKNIFHQDHACAVKVH